MALSLDEVLSLTGGRLVNRDRLGSSAGSARVERPSALDGAGPRDLAYFFSRDYEKDLSKANPGVLITGEPFVKPLEASGLPIWAKAAVVACADPYLAMAVLSGKFAEKLSTVAHLRNPERSEIHPSAVVDPTAELGRAVRVGPGCVIEAGARIGEGSVLYPGCFIGPGAKLGAGCVLFPQVTVYEWVEMGSRVRVHAGSRIGADGFGYAPRREGKAVVGHQKIHHLGRVLIGDDVEIGANSTIDRGTLGDTVIGSHAKLDNLVHIGHNARLGEGTVVCGGTCFAGRAKTGRFATIGGLSGIANDVLVGDGAQVGALTLVTKDVPAGGTAVGIPAREYREHFKAHALLNRLLAEKSKGRSDGSG